MVAGCRCQAGIFPNLEYGVAPHAIIILCNLVALKAHTSRASLNRLLAFSEESPGRLRTRTPDVWMYSHDGVRVSPNLYLLVGPVSTKLNHGSPWKSAL